MDNTNAFISDSDIKEINTNLEKAERYEMALREIDNYIRSAADPIPNIIRTIKKSLPEYKEVTSKNEGMNLMKTNNDKVTINDLFAVWEKELGKDKAILISCCYPIKQVLAMSDEDAEAEVEAINFEG